MKIKSFVMLMSLLATTSVLASTSHDTKKLQVPFVAEAVNSTNYNGITFSYNMNNSTQKVVCSLSYFYKGWMEYSENQSVKSSGTYGGSQTVVLTSVGPTHEISETLDQFHADGVGEVKIFNLQGVRDAFVSCFYVPEKKN
ncbi:MAG: hypothetical protein ACYCQI_14675 [Gammaproteobacteria bacterium]